MTSKLTALVEAAKADCVAREGNYGELCGYGDDILELCALLEKAEGVLADTQKVMNMWPSSSLDIAVTEALAAIKQWKEQT